VGVFLRGCDTREKTLRNQQLLSVLWIGDSPKRTWMGKVPFGLPICPLAIKGPLLCALWVVLSWQSWEAY